MGSASGRVRNGLGVLGRALRSPLASAARVRRAARGLATRLLRRPYDAGATTTPADPARSSEQRVAQLALFHHYRALVASGAPLPSLHDVGFRVFSQNDEDGLLLYVFALVGFRTRVVLELCAGDGLECNAANLIVNHGCAGLLFDGNDALLERGRRFYAAHPTTRSFQPLLRRAWITRDNVDALVERHMFPGVLRGEREIDLLSLDLDGNDYWVLERLTCVRPRVIVVEFNAIWGARRAVSIPYDPEFRCVLEPVPYSGASLPAFVKLLRPRGYRLVAVERLGFNAVFVRDDLAVATLPEVSAQEGLRGPIVGICQAGLERDPRLAAYALSQPWVEV